MCCIFRGLVTQNPKKDKKYADTVNRNSILFYVTLLFFIILGNRNIIMRKYTILIRYYYFKLH